MSDFGYRIRPEEVTPEVRHRLENDNRASEFLALASVVIACVVLALGFSLVYRWHGDAPGTELPSIYPLIAICVVVGLAVHFWFRRERKFIDSSPVTSAEVEKIEAPEVSMQPHRVVLKFRPANAPKKRTVSTTEEIEVVSEVRTTAPAFNEELHAGDKVAVIYDPRNPAHIRVVEEEHEVVESG